MATIAVRLVNKLTGEDAWLKITDNDDHRLLFARMGDNGWALDKQTKPKILRVIDGGIGGPRGYATHSAFLRP